MKWTLAASFVPITMISLGLVYLQYRLHRAQRGAGTLKVRGFDVIPSMQGGVA